MKIRYLFTLTRKARIQRNEGVSKMARKRTSKRVARIASKVLRSRRQDKKSKIAAASALSQREKFRQRRKKRRG